MKFREMKTNSFYERYYFPASESAARACMLANSNYLRQDQLKILELLGHKIELSSEKLGEIYDSFNGSRKKARRI